MHANDTHIMLEIFKYMDTTAIHCAMWNICNYAITFIMPRM